MNVDGEFIKFVFKLERQFNLIDYIREFSKIKDGWTYCPLHAGTKPNLIVQRKNGFNFFICCICRSYGDLIAFQMLHLKQSFHEVIERLATEANFEIPASVKEEIEIYNSRKK